MALFIQVLDGDTSHTADVVLVVDDRRVVKDLGRSLARRLGVSFSPSGPPRPAPVPLLTQERKR
jgi:hypothetical protein